MSQNPSLMDHRIKNSHKVGRGAGGKFVSLAEILPEEMADGQDEHLFVSIEEVDNFTLLGHAGILPRLDLKDPYLDFDDEELQILRLFGEDEDDVVAQLAYYDELAAEFAEPQEPNYRAEGLLYEADRYEDLELQMPSRHSYTANISAEHYLWILLGFKDLDEAQFGAYLARKKYAEAQYGYGNTVSIEELDCRRQALHDAMTHQDWWRNWLAEHLGRTIMAPIRRKHIPCRQSPWKDRKAPHQWARHQPRHRSTIPPIEVINTRAAWIEEQEAVVEIVIRAMFMDEPDVLPRGTPIELALELAAA